MEKVMEKIDPVGSKVKLRKDTGRTKADHQLRMKCDKCGDTFWSSRKWARFCSRGCRVNYHYDKKWEASNGKQIQIDNG